MFDDMMNDRIAVVKQDGRRFNGISCAFGREAVTFFDVTIPLEEGDHIERVLPAGRTELYEVLDACFVAGGEGHPDFYRAKVRKTTSRLPQHTGFTSINVSGPNARVNLNSVDSSTNSIGSSVPPEVFADVLAILRANIPSPDALNDLEKKVRALEATTGTSAYNRAYADFMQLSANWMTILAPFLPALSRGLSGG